MFCIGCQEKQKVRDRFSTSKSAAHECLAIVQNNDSIYNQFIVGYGILVAILSSSSHIDQNYREECEYRGNLNVFSVIRNGIL